MSSCHYTLVRCVKTKSGDDRAVKVVSVLADYSQFVRAEATVTRRKGQLKEVILAYFLRTLPFRQPFVYLSCSSYIGVVVKRKRNKQEAEAARFFQCSVGIFLGRLWSLA